MKRIRKYIEYALATYFLAYFIVLEVFITSPTLNKNLRTLATVAYILYLCSTTPRSKWFIKLTNRIKKQ
jgi:hypothetical protein